MTSTLEKILRILTSRDDIHTPIYISDADVFKMNINGIIGSFRSRYSNYNLGFSFKTNYDRRFIEAALDAGCYAEVVSPIEKDYAIELGFPKNRIIYNGVIPDVEGKYDVARCGGIVNFDNREELLSFIDYAKKKKSNEKIAIGIRLNIDIGNGVVSRFGMNYDDETDREIIRSVAFDRNKFVSLKTIHCHVSYGRETSFFERRARIMVSIAKELEVKRVDIGGNMYGPMEPTLSVQYGEHIPSYDEYADVICPIFKREFENSDVELITENGTAVASTAMSMLVTVIGKKVVNGVTKVVVDTRNDCIGYVCANRNVPIVNLYGDSPTTEHAEIYGCSCVEGDILHRDYVGRVEIGDKLLIMNLGSYSRNRANNFITRCPDVFYV